MTHQRDYVLAQVDPQDDALVAHQKVTGPNVWLRRSLSLVGCDPLRCRWSFRSELLLQGHQTRAVGKLTMPPQTITKEGGNSRQHVGQRGTSRGKGAEAHSPNELCYFPHNRGIFDAAGSTLHPQCYLRVDRVCVGMKGYASRMGPLVEVRDIDNPQQMGGVKSQRACAKKEESYQPSAHKMCPIHRCERSIPLVTLQISMIFSRNVPHGQSHARPIRPPSPCVPSDFHRVQDSSRTTPREQESGP